MALVKKQANAQRTIIYIVILVVAILTTLYYAVIAPTLNHGSSSTTGTTSPQEQQGRDLRALEERLIPDLDKVSSDPRFQSLKQYGDTQVQAAPMGRSNPFQPL